MREGDLIILLGAGTSVEAGIPASSQMVTKVEGLLEHDEHWKPYYMLYRCIKASLIGADVMKGKPYTEPDIERIVNTLSELEKNTDCTLYPFISGWHQRVGELAGKDFEHIKAFRRLIVKQLRDWIAINSYARADYYEGFYRLRDELCERRSESAPSWPVWRCATHVFEQAQAHVGAGARERGEVRSGQGILFRTSGYPPRRRQDREPWMTTRAWYPS